MAEEKVAVVTGSSSGIGLLTAVELALNRYRVVATMRNLENRGRLEEAAQKAGVRDRLDLRRLDITEFDTLLGAVDAIIREHGRIDVLVNNAGITRDQLLVRMKDEDWDQVLDTNLRGVFLMTRAVGKVMMRQRSGRIINIASTAGAMGNPGQVNYSAAKAGVIGLTKAAGRELAHWNILVNAVAPGLIETDMAAAIPAEAREAMLQQVPLKRIGQGREVAEVVRFLAGDGASYITGQTIHVNGGLYV
jgi:3-oxoacyl-[acyl-carrier protein] reductase